MTNAGGGVRGMLVAGGIALAVAACSSGGGGSLADLLALVAPEEEGRAFAVVLGDVRAHREVVGIEAPSPDASAEELSDHLATLSEPGGGQPAAFGMSRLATVSGSELGQLARSNAYITTDRGTTAVFVGDLAESAFGEGEPDDQVGGAAVVPLEVGYGLVVDDGTVTVAGDADLLDAALGAQLGEAESLADVPAAAAVVSVLDELDVIHGSATGYSDGGPGVAAAVGVAVDPNQEGSWLLIVAHHLGGDVAVDDATETLEDLAADFAAEGDAEVVEVAPRGDVATAMLRVDDPNTWFGLQQRFDPLVVPWFHD